MSPPTPISDPADAISASSVEKGKDDGAETPPASASQASVLSSSFRMTVTALRLPPTGGGVRRGGRSLLEGTDGIDPIQSAEEKEGPAIREHLSRVYSEALSVPPEGVSLVFEEDVVAEEIGGGQGFDMGVVRRTTFRVLGE